MTTSVERVGTGQEIPRGWAAAAGVLAAAAGIAAGQLTAALLAPASSPFVAVGDVVIRLSPLPLTEFAKQTFGTADKAVLLTGMAVVIAGIAALGGLAARRRPAAGLVVLTALGVVGAAAVLARQAVTAIDILAPLAAGGVAVVVFRWLHALASRSGAVAAGRDGPSRRDLIRAAVAVGAASLVGGGAGVAVGRGAGAAQAAVTSRLAGLPVRRAAPIPAGAAFPELGTPTFLTPIRDFYRIDTALRIPRIDPQDWSLRIHGMVARERTLSFDDLLARPLVERTITMACVSNPVGGGLISTANFVGVDLRDLLLEVGVLPGADQLYSTSSDGWYTGTPVEVLLEPGRDAMLAIGMNAEPLTPEHGFPVRMVVPGLYGYVSATKWVVDLELTTFAEKVGYWTAGGRGWSPLGPIKTQCRIDTPRGFARVPAGRLAVAGIAWSQPRGISRVEVRLDGGPWQEAVLATEVGGDTWRMWRAEVEVAPGPHTVDARATDADGATQTEVRAEPVPDGATGWPSVAFSAS